MGLNDKAYRFFETGKIETKLRQWIRQYKLLELNEERLRTTEFSDATRKRRVESYKAWKEWVNGK